MSLRIKNWSRHQHFKDRRPPWIKLYRELLDDHEWHSLDPEASKLLVMLWLLASENEGKLPEPKTIAFRLRTSEAHVTEQIGKLGHWLEEAGYQDDITMISSRYQLVSVADIETPLRDRGEESREETETKTDNTPLPPKGGEEEEVVMVDVISETSPRIEKTAQKSQVSGGDIAETFRSDTSLSLAQETPHGKVIEDRFLEFWHAYPENRRKNLYRAQSAFSCSLHTLPPQSELLKSLEAFKRSKEWRQDNGKFIPSPETWIAERRWQDAPAFSGDIKPKRKTDINEADAFAWRSEAYPESLEVHPTASTFPFKTWPESIRREYLDSRKTNHPQTQAA